MALDAGRRRLIAFLVLAVPALAARSALAQGVPPPRVAPNAPPPRVAPNAPPRPSGGGPNEAKTEDIGIWRVVHQYLSARAFLVPDGGGTRSAYIKEGNRSLGGQTKIEIGYNPVPGRIKGHSGKLYVEAAGGVMGDFSAKLFVDGTETTQFHSGLGNALDLQQVFGPDLAKLRTTQHLRVEMPLRDTTLTVLDIDLVPDDTARMLDVLKSRAERNFVSMHPSGEMPQRKGCFVTTAACGLIGLADDCFELTALRRFRDEVMARTGSGRADIALYYRTAPAILAEIDRRGDRRRLLRLYFTHILTSALAARFGLRRLPWRIYRDMMHRLTARYLPDG